VLTEIVVAIFVAIMSAVGVLIMHWMSNVDNQLSSLASLLDNFKTRIAVLEERSVTNKEFHSKIHELNSRIDDNRIGIKTLVAHVTHKPGR